MPDPTPGQVNYVAFLHAGSPEMAADACARWQTVRPDVQRAWEAAAQAVLDDDSDGRHRVVAHFRYAIGARLQLAAGGRPCTVRARRWIEREVLGPYAEYGLESKTSRALCWEVEADLRPWAEDPDA